MDSLGARMKLYEQYESDRRFLPLVPIIARMDGKCFHSFTSVLKRPYDSRLSDLMVETTKFLVGETGACIGYTQSDEISLVFYRDDIKSQVFFDRRIAKMTSVLAAFTTAKFNQLLPKFIPEKQNELPVFDCRVWTVPTRVEAVNSLIWRELDATRNSISMAAQTYYSHDQLMNKSESEMQEMLFQQGINWNDYPDFFKRGIYVQRTKVKRRFISEEVDKLPPKHEARLNPNLEIERAEIVVLEMPPLTRLMNRIGVVFDGEKPKPIQPLLSACNKIT